MQFLTLCTAVPCRSLEIDIRNLRLMTQMDDLLALAECGMEDASNR